MTCKQAERLMMRYLDAEMTQEEAKWLHRHLDQCSSCKELFLQYDALAQMLEEQEHPQAPEGFEKAILAQVAVLPVPERKWWFVRPNWLKRLMGGLFAFCLLIGSLLVRYREILLAELSDHPIFGSMGGSLAVLIQQFNTETSYVLDLLDQTFRVADAYLQSLAVPFALALGGICLLQVILLRKK